MTPPRTLDAWLALLVRQLEVRSRSSPTQATRDEAAGQLAAVRALMEQARERAERIGWYCEKCQSVTNGVRCATCVDNAAIDAARNAEVPA